MGRFYILFTVMLSLCSCSTKNEEKEERRVNHNYEEVSDKRVSWSQIFKQENDDYLCYFYSETCGHCQNLKNEIIEYSFTSPIPFYFVKNSPDFIVSENIEDTIGVSSLEHFFIKGTPSLIEIKNKKVNKNIAGEIKIRDYIS